MKKVMMVAVLSVALAACSGNKKNNESESSTTNTTTADATHNSRNSVDYTGTYTGTLPCADCSGIRTELILGNDSYTLRSTYIGKGDEKPIEKTGKYTWDNNGKIITLQGITDSPSKFQVGENLVYQLDMEGNRIEGDLAPNYILRKK